jgi:hypothetical protein
MPECVFTLYSPKDSQVFCVTQQALNNVGKIELEEVQVTSDVQQDPTINSLGAGSLLTTKCTRVTQQGNIIGQWCYAFQIPANCVLDDAGNYLPEGTLSVNFPLENTYFYNDKPPSDLTEDIQTPLIVSGNPTEYVPPGQKSASFDGMVLGWESTNGYFCATGTVVKTKYADMSPMSNYRMFEFSLMLQQ